MTSTAQSATWTRHETGTELAVCILETTARYGEAFYRVCKAGADERCCFLVRADDVRAA